MRNSKPILLIEDDDIDVLSVSRALADLKVTNEIIHKHNSEEALEYLKNHANEKPCIILLDLGLPKIDGIEFLKILRSDQTLENITVVVLTALKDEHNILETFQLSVAGYIVKKPGYNDLLEMLKTVNTYWTLSEMPTGD